MTYNEFVVSKTYLIQNCETAWLLQLVYTLPHRHYELLSFECFYE